MTATNVTTHVVDVEPTRGLSVRAPRSRLSIQITGGIAVCLLGLGSCEWGEPYVEPYVTPERVVCRFMGMPCAPDCSRFYNNGHHNEWATCIGVRYK